MKKYILISIFFCTSTLLYSQNGWQILQTDTQHNLSDIHFINENTGWAVGDSGTILKTINGGKDWVHQVSNTLKPLHAIIFSDSLNGSAVGNYYEYNPWCFNNTVRLVTSNGGNTWTVAHIGYSSMIMDVTNFENNFYISYEGSDCWATIGSVVRSTNSGIDWQAITSGFAGHAFRSVCFLNLNTGWAVGNRSTDYGIRIHMLIKTTNAGLNWEYIQRDTTYAYLPYWGKKLRFLNESTGYILSESYRNLKKTTDGGLTWNQTDSNFTSGTSDYFFTSPDTGWSIKGNSIIKTTDGGNNWSLQNSGVTNYLRSVYFVNENLGYVTGSNGLILKTVTGGITNLDTSEQFLPKEYSLHQNYPNPFNPLTTISFSLPHPSYVKLEVFDAAGREIKELINERRQTGSYEIKFNGGDFASGIYFYRLAADDFIAVRRMILLK